MNKNTFIIISVIQFGLIAFLFFKNFDDGHYHGNYAKKYHQHNMELSPHEHSYASIYHEHNFEENDLSADDIDYNEYAYGGYGTLQAKIKDLESKIDNFDVKIFDIDNNRSRIDYMEIELIGKANSLHYHY
tara:strand:- start:182 stop:574 length:393 start_codon:yes stop_codon:yes gene_type:complete